ncbi:hypothetical protein DPMN_136179 [Dreissena polymorpha]|uniref:Uncharacterized protein n=1 Tax=Dreissena polymorpha TaxID=45954 RepID=A0A9D4JCE7_DREPO|nr:hypothetical protein DPMN_136179 [Dreissena polymorpha]
MSGAVLILGCILAIAGAYLLRRRECRQDDNIDDATEQSEQQQHLFIPGYVEPRKSDCQKYCNLNTPDSGLHHTVSLMYVGRRHIGFGTTLENKMAAPRKEEKFKCVF